MKPLAECRVLVITGAGISAESGIPTFRGPAGYWRSLDPTKLATEAAFRADPLLVWDWYRERRAKIRSCAPNAAHTALVQLATVAREFLLVTQNVDDLHERAIWRERQLTAQQLVHIHGEIFVTRCTRCAHRQIDAICDASGVPACPRCGNRLRPGVVWFGENLASSEMARVEAFLSCGKCDVVLVVGTTALFGYIVELAISARADDGALIEINPEATPLSDQATHRLCGAAAIELPRWVDERMGPI